MPDKKTSGKSGVADPATIVDMKTAVKTAMAFIQDLIPTARDLRLEEVESGGPGWLVVISYAANQSPSFAVIRGEEEPRIFKKIPIDSESGIPQSLKAWK